MSCKDVGQVSTIDLGLVQGLGLGVYEDWKTDVCFLCVVGSWPYT